MASAHGASDGAQQPQQRDRRSSPAARGRGEEIAAYFTAMDNAELSRRGRLVAELAAPHFVTQCNGVAARLLKAGASRITSRRIKGICETEADGSKLARACHKAAQKQTLRAYLSIVVAGKHVPVLVQQIEQQPGHHTLEVLLFATDECHPRLVSDVVVESILSRAPSRESSPDTGNITPARSKEVDLQVQMDPCEDETESLLGLGTASLTAKAVSADVTCKVVGFEEAVQTRCATS